MWLNYRICRFLLSIILWNFQAETVQWATSLCPSSSYRILLNKCSLRRDRHPGGVRQAIGTTQMFSDIFAQFALFFTCVWSPHQIFGVAYQKEMGECLFKHERLFGTIRYSVLKWGPQVLLVTPQYLPCGFLHPAFQCYKQWKVFFFQR